MIPTVRPIDRDCPECGFRLLSNGKTVWCGRPGETPGTDRACGYEEKVAGQTDAIAPAEPKS